MALLTRMRRRVVGACGGSAPGTRDEVAPGVRGGSAPGGGGGSGPPRSARWAGVVLLLLAAACATGAPVAGAEAGEARPEEADSAAIAREVEAEAEARRAASERLVASGRALLEEGRAEEAAGVLERAVRRDPSNGHAYLALARARIRLGQEGTAVGLLERAAALLRADDPRAAAQADSLRAALEGPEGR